MCYVVSMRHMYISTGNTPSTLRLVGAYHT